MKFRSVLVAAGTAFALIAGGSQALATDLVNPDDLQSSVIEYGQNLPSSSGAQPAAIGNWDSAGVAILAAARNQNVAAHNGSFRTSFSTAAVGNHPTWPTGVKFSGESQVIWTGTKIPKSIKLIDKITVTGIGLSVSVGTSGGSVSGGPTNKIYNWTSTANSSKRVDHTFRNVNFGGAPVLRVKEAATGSVTFGSSTYSHVAGTL